MASKPSPSRYPRINLTYLLVVIGELLALVALFIFAPAAVTTVELLGPLFAFLLQILARA